MHPIQHNYFKRRRKIKPPVIQPEDLTFNYTLLEDATVSAGVYDGDELIRTLFSGEPRQAGVYSYTWDGLKDDKTPAAKKVYTVKILKNNVTYQWNGARIGNSSTDLSGSGKHRAFQGIVDVIVISDTKAYYFTNYNEGWTTIFRFNPSSPQSRVRIKETFQTNAVSSVGCYDGTNIYVGAFHDYKEQGDEESVRTSFLWAFRVSDDTEITFPSGSSYSVSNKSARIYPSIVNKLENANGEITGIAANATHLFIARKGLNTITVTTKAGAFVRTITTFTAPERMLFNGIDSLWIASAAGATKHTINSDGTLSASTLTLDVDDPMAFATDGTNISVCDGSDEVVKTFNNTTGASVWTLGGGNYPTDPNVSNDKFLMRDRNENIFNTFKTCIAYQPNGSFWVGDGGNYRLQHFSAAREFIDRIMYLPHSYSISLDKNNPVKIFNEFMEFNSNTRELVRNYRGAIPEGYFYPSIRGFKWVNTLSNGRTYAILKQEVSPHKPIIVEIPEHGPIRLTKKQFDTHERVSLLPNGDVFRYNIVGGNMVFKLDALTGFDGDGDPILAASVTIATTPISATDPVNYSDAKMGLRSPSGGIIVADKEGYQNGHGHGYHLGLINPSTGKYIWKAAHATPVGYTGAFPVDGRFDIGNTVKEAGAGGNITVQGNNLFLNYVGEFWKRSQTNYINHFHADTGLFIGQCGTWKDNFREEAKPQLAGNAFSIESCIKDGKLYLYHSDESIHAGIHEWEVNNTESIEIINTTVTVPTGVIPEVPSNIRIGLNTSIELNAWKERATAKTAFSTKSDVKTNSPGILSTLTEMANQLVNNPLIDRFTGPTYYNADGGGTVTYSGSYYIHKNSYPEPGNKGSRVKAAAILGVAQNNQSYINAAKSAILDFIAQPINQFPVYSVDWPANGTMWKPGAIGDINPLFIYAQYFKKYTEAYSLLKSYFSSTQITDIENCLYAFGKFATRETNAGMSGIWTNRNPETNKHAVGYTWNGDWTGSQRKMFDGTGTPKASLVSLYLNNRRLECLAGALPIGILKNDDYIISSAYVFVKEWLKYGCYPWNGEVLPGELERASEGGFNDKGVSYSLVMIGLAVYIAHLIEIYKKNPVTGVEYPSLFSYSTSEGYAPSGGYSSVGGPKSLATVGKSVLKMVNGELNLYYNNVKLDGYRESPLWHFTEDTTLAAALYAYYKDEFFRKSALREHPGSRPFPSSGNGSGAYKSYEGFGGGDWWLFTRFFPTENVSLY